MGLKNKPRISLGNQVQNYHHVTRLVVNNAE